MLLFSMWNLESDVNLWPTVEKDVIIPFISCNWRNRQYCRSQSRACQCHVKRRVNEMHKIRWLKPTKNNATQGKRKAYEILDFFFLLWADLRRRSLYLSSLHHYDALIKLLSLDFPSDSCQNFVYFCLESYPFQVNVIPISTCDSFLLQMEMKGILLSLDQNCLGVQVIFLLAVLPFFCLFCLDILSFLVLTFLLTAWLTGNWILWCLLWQEPRKGKRESREEGQMNFLVLFPCLTSRFLCQQPC